MKSFMKILEGVDSDIEDQVSPDSPWEDIVPAAFDNDCEYYWYEIILNSPINIAKKEILRYASRGNDYNGDFTGDPDNIDELAYWGEYLDRESQSFIYERIEKACSQQEHQKVAKFLIDSLEEYDKTGKSVNEELKSQVVSRLGEDRCNQLVPCYDGSDE